MSKQIQIQKRQTKRSTDRPDAPPATAKIIKTWFPSEGE
jgi:hypothetical protein